MKTGVSYFHVRDPRHVAKDLDDMAEHGCNFVVHCYSELDMAFYNKAMEKIIRLTKDRGMEVYLDPWGLGGMYGGETFSRFVAENLNARQIDSKGKSLPAACPNNSDFRELQKRWIKRAAEFGADVCFWDEPHFHYNFFDPSTWGDPWTCRCDTCKRLFEERYNTAMPSEMTEEMRLFRERSLLEFLETMCDDAKERGMENCVCVLPDEGGQLGVAAGTSGWEYIARIPSVDIFGTDPYWILFNRELEEYVTGTCRRIIELCDKYGKEAQAWALAFAIPKGREEEVGRAVELMYETGIRNIAAWGYRGCDVIDIMAKEPEKVWDILGNAYKKIQKKSGKEG